MIKFIHSGDLHLGSPFSSFDPPRAATLRKSLVRSFKAMVEYCKNVRADLLLLSGDIFDSSRPSADTIELFCSELERLNGTKIFAVLGNHDCGAVIPPIKNLHVFSAKPEEIYIPELDAHIYGQSFFTENPPPMTEVLSCRPEETNLLCLHANLDADSYNPIPSKSLSGFRYAALGHRHGFFLENNGRSAICYSGCLAGRGFDELGEKGFVYGEIDGLKTNVKFIPSEAPVFEEIFFSGGEDSLDSFASHLNPGGLYRVNLSGSLSPAIVKSRLEKKVFYAEVRCLSSSFPDSPFFKLLKEELSSNPRALELAANALMGKEDLF